MPLAGSVSTSFAPNARSTARRSGLIDSGIVRMTSYPFTAATNASAMPVLPLVGSTIVETPGSISPSRSATSIIARPIRSFTLFAGFRLSSFATMRGFTPATMRLSCTSGVRPTSSVASRAIFTAISWKPRAHPEASYPALALRVMGDARTARILDRSEQLLDQHRRVAARRKLAAQQHAVAVAIERQLAGPHADRAPRTARAHAGQAQRIGIEPVRRHHRALALRHGALRPGHARAKDGTRGADLEAPRALLLGRGIAHGEHSARVVAHREIARLELVERDRARREHGVEHLRLPRRDEEARVAAVAHGELARAEPARALRVVAGAAEALLAEAVGQPARVDLRAPRLCARERARVHAVQSDREAVAAQLSGAELVRMARGFEHTRAGQLQREGDLGIEARHREPLGCHRHAVLAARITHVLRPRPGRAREVARHRLGGSQALLDAHERVSADAHRGVERLLVNAKVLGRGADPDHGNSASWEIRVKLFRCAGHGPSRVSASTCSRVA